MVIPALPDHWLCVVCNVKVPRIKRVGMYCKACKGKRLHSIVCQSCGASVMRTNYRARFCTECQRLPNTPKPPQTKLRWRQCTHCSRWICRPGPSKYCDKSCAHEATMTAQGRRNRACKRCGEPLDRISLDIYCRPCVKQNKSDRKARERKNPDYSNLSNHRQRARHYGVEYEPVKRSKVLDRDRWQCGICHKSISKSLKSPHPMSASLDHVVPMALGGGHTYQNCQASHLICNSTKSHHGYGDQLAMFG